MIDVTCALIRNEEDEVLVVQKGADTDHPLKWEFPGGKIKKGESQEECIIREIHEELSMDIVITGRLSDVIYDYGHKEIRLIPFICDTLDESPVLTEHVAGKWINAANLRYVDFAEADLIVAADYISKVSKDNTVKPTVDKIPVPDDKELLSMIDNMMSLKQVDWLAASAIENPGIFMKLLKFSYSHDKKLAFHASWILTKVFDKYPDIINPYLPQIAESLQNIDNESALRSFLRIISLSDMGKLKEKQHGVLADLCFKLLNSGFSAIAIKAYSMEILYRLSVIYPDLCPELIASLKNVLEYKSAGINSKARTIMRKLNQSFD